MPLVALEQGWSKPCGFHRADSSRRLRGSFIQSGFGRGLTGLPRPSQRLSVLRNAVQPPRYGQSMPGDPRSRLWEAAFANPVDPALAQRLVVSWRQVREHAAAIADRIRFDLPDFTMHDVVRH